MTAVTFFPLDEKPGEPLETDDGGFMNLDDLVFVDIKALRKRGWTLTLINRFLGEKPDQRRAVNHPIYSYTSKKTYILSRVVEIERSVEFELLFFLRPSGEDSMQIRSSSSCGIVTRSLSKLAGACGKNPPIWLAFSMESGLLRLWS